MSALHLRDSPWIFTAVRRMRQVSSRIRVIGSIVQKFTGSARANAAPSALANEKTNGVRCAAQVVLFKSDTRKWTTQRTVSMSHRDLFILSGILIAIIRRFA